MTPTARICAELDAINAELRRYLRELQAMKRRAEFRLIKGEKR